MPTSHQLTLLIIDDNPVSQRILHATLLKVGYRVLLAGSGLVGRDLALGELPDLILLDVMMPGESGFETLEKLRSQSKTSDIPVIFITGASDPSSKLKGFELGAVDYITKPFNPAELLARIKVQLRLRLATQALISAQAEKLRQLSKAQATMLTQTHTLPEAKCGVHYTSLHEAGGDFYEVLSLASSVHSYLVADVSGHDVGTSFVTPAMKALLKQNSSLVHEPDETLAIINKILLDILPTGKYITCAYARLCRANNELIISSAGHPPICYQPKDAPAYLIELPGTPLGIFANSDISSQTIKTNPGDRFYLYSDGLLERSAEGTVWTANTGLLLDQIAKVQDVPIDKAPDLLTNLLAQNRAAADDDIVVLAVEV